MKLSRKPVPSSDSLLVAPSLPPRPGSVAVSAVPSGQTEEQEGSWSSRNHSDEGLVSSPGGVENVKAIRRKPVEASQAMQSVIVPSPEDRRQPLGPRPQPSRQQQQGTTYSGMENQSMNKFEPGPPLPPRKNVGSGIQPLTTFTPATESSFWEETPVAADPDATPRPQHTHQDQSLSPSGASPSTVTDLSSLTLIRRDPSSGAQWNVGKILAAVSYPTSSHNTSPSRRRSRSSPGRDNTTATAPPIRIEISNPGYNKFINAHQATGLFSSSSHLPLNTSAEELRRMSASDESGLGERIFRRQISGETVRSWFGTAGRKRRSGSERQEIGSDDVGGMQHALDPEFSGGDTTRRGYAFLSPWSGTCEFYTGASGRSLKVCLIPSSLPSSFKFIPILFSNQFIAPRHRPSCTDSISSSIGPDMYIR